MTHEERLKIFQDEAKRVGFDHFLRETNARINELKENGIKLYLFMYRKY